MSITIHLTDTDGKTHDLTVEPGDTLMQVAVDAGLDIRAECGGCLACATCHMYIDPEWFQKLASREEDEEDMLDFADNVKESSRLSCQIELTKEMDGLRATIAPGM